MVLLAEPLPNALNALEGVGGGVEPAGGEVVGSDAGHGSAYEGRAGDLLVDRYAVELHRQFELLFGPAYFQPARDRGQAGAIDDLNLGDLRRANLLARHIVDELVVGDLRLSATGLAALEDDEMPPAQRAASVLAQWLDDGLISRIA